ncbi:MAG: hypothetical protein COB97_05940 [Paracoccus sp.]|nr:MAG: hypothetical protein COB97_05940 [Paracoccus sp. (in: a-proteobacteria)]
MAYKTILTVLTEKRQTPQLDAAAALAVREDAHLDILCLGIDHSQAGYYFPGGTPYAFQEAIDSAMEQAESLEQAVRRHLVSAADLRWSVDSAVAQIGGIANLVGMRARFSDLTVLGRPYGGDAPGDAEAVTEAALFEGGCPVLILPDTGLADQPPRRILVAWNQSVEALAAVRRALPFYEVKALTMRDDWPKKRDLARREIRAFVNKARDEGRRVLVVPYRLSGFGPQASMLKGLEIVTDGKGLLPDPAVGNWMLDQAAAAIENAGWDG